MTVMLTFVVGHESLRILIVPVAGDEKPGQTLQALPLVHVLFAGLRARNSHRHR